MRSSHVKRLLVALLLVTVGQPLTAQVRIVLLGVTNDMDLVSRWAGAAEAKTEQVEGARYFRLRAADAIVLAPLPGNSLADLARLLHGADAAVIVVDATQGPLPMNREHVIVARQARVPTVSILLANVDELHAQVPGDAVELLRLEAAEMRDVMSAYELDGQSALLFHDAARRGNALAGSAGGLDDAGRVLARRGKRRDSNDVARTYQGARGQVYLLTDAEVNGRGISLTGPTVMLAWSEGFAAVVEVTSEAPAAPGDVAAVTLRTQSLIRGSAGSRFMLIENDRVVGIGVLTEGIP